MPTVNDSVGIAVSDDNRFVYTTSDYDVIGVNDTQTGQFAGSVNLTAYTSYPNGIVYCCGKLYVESFDNIIIVDAASLTVERVLDQPFVIGLTQSDITLSPDGRYAYAVSGSSYVMSVIDTMQNDIVDSIQIDRDNTDVSLSPDGTRAYVLNPRTGLATIIELSTHRVLAAVDFTGGQSFLNIPAESAVRSNGTLYVAWLDPLYHGHISRLDPDGRFIRDVPLPGYSTGLAFSLDERYILTGGGFVLDADTGAVVDQFAMVPGQSRVVFSTSGERGYVTNDNTQFVTVVEGFHPSFTFTGLPSWGRTVTLNLLAPGQEGELYQIVASCSIGQGVALPDGRVFPVNRDLLFHDSVLSRTPAYVNFAGHIGATSQATAYLRIGSDLRGKTIGETVYLCFATFRDNVRAPRRIQTISNVIAITILP
ncbi:MAG: YncE family protein [Planctomycetes bacterium]|nr:YncE family protein [Planctomycetota bacterium]MBI3843618.1 YncE family protein [Planctomycetota bacterium]